MNFPFYNLKNKQMKYNRLIARIFAQKSNNNAQVAVALVAGLAAGAIISILFAPDKGSNIRRGIADQAKGLGTGIKDKYSNLRNRALGVKELEESIEQPEVPHFAHTTPKKRKSAIKDIVHEAHVEKQQHTEQPIG
jgi:gas vesicle protein